MTAKTKVKFSAEFHRSKSDSKKNLERKLIKERTKSSSVEQNLIDGTNQDDNFHIRAEEDREDNLIKATTEG